MFAAGVGAHARLIGSPNERIVSNPDPSSPVVTDPAAEGQDQQFMRLMIEQLKNQDPLSPLKSNEFTTQLSQINSLQQLINLNKSFENFFGAGQLAEATSLIGKYVEGLDAKNNIIKGIVETVEVLDGMPTLKVDDQLLLVSQVVTVSDPEVGKGGDM